MTYLERTDTFMDSLGLETYRVGGSVRDEILGRRCKDADYVIRGASLFTIATELRRAGAGYIPKFAISPLKLRDGVQVGWRVSGRGLGVIEISLPRTEISTGPGRHDFEIVVDPLATVDTDAYRRDFTFNALYRRLADDEVLDATGRGLYDLERGIIHTTYTHSFRDDPLRILRALRFVSTLGYTVSASTTEQMVAYADAVTGLTVGGVSGTVLAEMDKLLMGQAPDPALRLAVDTGVLAVLFPELEPMIGFEQESRYHDLTVDQHTIAAIKVAAHVNAPLRVRWALLFHDSGKPESAWRGEDGRLHYYAKGDKEDHAVIGARIWREAAARLNFPRELRNDVSSLILNHMVPSGKRNPSAWVARARIKFGDDLLRDLLLHACCDASGKDQRKSADQIAAFGELEAIREALSVAGVPASVKDLEISGFDAAEKGLKGREIGEALHRVLDEVAVDPTDLKRSREWQLGRL